MAHSLQQQVRSIRRKARTHAFLIAASCVLLTLLASLLAVGIVDYLVRFEYLPARILCSLAVVGVVVASVVRWLAPLWHRRMTDLDVAQRLQQQFPELGDALASSLEFLEESETDPTAGSAALRRAVIVSTQSQVEALPLNSVFDLRPVRTAVGALVATLAAVVLFAIFNPQYALIGAARLTNPFNQVAWPRYYNLEFTAKPIQIASGDTFEVELTDRDGRLPEMVWIDYRFDSTGEEKIVTAPMQFVNDTMVASRETVRQPFAYRARGGDHQSMPWIELDVVEPPRVESIKLQITPPAYTGWPITTSDGRIVALVGSALHLEAIATKPIKSATLQIQIGEETKQIEAELDAADPRKFRIDVAKEWTVAESGYFSLDLVDAEGIRGGASDKWQLRAIPDDLPTVGVEQPRTDIYVTEDAVVPLRVLAKDRLAIRSVGITYSRSDQSEKGDFSFDLFVGSEQPPARESSGLTLAGESGDRHVLDHAWDLGALEVPPGTQIHFNATASDYKPQTAQSPTQRIFVISPEEFEDRLSRQQANIIAEMGRILKMQIDARERLGKLQIQLDEVGSLEKSDIDQLQGVELTQRDIRRGLTSETEGVRHQIKALLDQVESNSLDAPDIERQMQGILDEIKRLGATALPAVEQHLISALKETQSEQDRENTTTTPAATEPLEDATENQDEVIATLEKLLGRLERWDNHRSFARELAAIGNLQERLGKDSGKMQGETIGKDAKDLTPQQKADLKKQGQGQKELARRLEKLMQRMGDAEEKVAESDPIAADSIKDALEHAAKKSLSRRMHETAGNVEKNRLGQASTQQGQLGKDIKEMHNVLSNRTENELSRLVKKLREAEKELKAAAEKQQRLRKKFKEAEAEKDEEEKKRKLRRLAAEQKKLEEEVDQLRRKLRRLQANKASRALAGAGEQMRQAGQAGDQGDQQQAEDAAKGAEKQLEEAQQELAEARKQAEQLLLAEKLAKLADQLASLTRRQQGLIDERVRLETLRQKMGRLTRGQLGSVADLGHAQDGLRADTEQTAQQLAEAEVFRLALDRAAKAMGRAERRLAELVTDESVEMPQQQALDQLAMIEAALNPKDEGKPKEGSEGGGGGGGGEQQGDGIHTIAELRLIKLLQQSLNDRTIELSDELVGDTEPTQDQIDELMEMSDQQRRLADYMFKLLETAAADPEDDPDAVLRPEEAPETVERDPDKDLDDVLPPLDEDGIDPEELIE